jgi:hypothetical protein
MRHLNTCTSKLRLPVLLLLLMVACKNDSPLQVPFTINADTTSHNFTWTRSTLGDRFLVNGASGLLRDVAIVNDTLAYAVGEIYTTDSSGQADPYAYSLAQWNGTTWTLKHMYYRIWDTNGPHTWRLSSISGIIAFGPSDVWLASGGIFHWNGTDTATDFSFNALVLGVPNAAIYHLWGASAKDIFGVGPVGTIVHYDGNYWTPLASGTILDIRDVYGNGNQVLAIASNFDAYRPWGRKLLSIDPVSMTVTSLPDSSLAYDLNSVWFVPGSIYYCAGAGLFHKSDLNSTQPWQLYPSGTVTSYATSSISGNAANDVFAAGSFMEIVHYNGSTWHNYSDVIPLDNGALNIEVKGNLAIAVGLDGADAVAYVGRR